MFLLESPGRVQRRLLNEWKSREIYSGLFWGKGLGIELPLGARPPRGCRVLRFRHICFFVWFLTLPYTSASSEPPYLWLLHNDNLPALSVPSLTLILLIISSQTLPCAMLCLCPGFPLPHFSGKHWPNRAVRVFWLQTIENKSITFYYK